MSGVVEYKEEAIRDMKEISDDIGRNNVGVAHDFLDMVRRQAEFLASMRGAGAIRNFDNPALAGVRSWPMTRFRKYLIFYRPTTIGVEILRVVHGARDLETMFEE
jgi:toxin ParE1/3/4